jgi:hypothetical protein
MRLRAICVPACLLASAVILSGCVTNGIPGAAGITGVTPAPTTTNSRQKSAFNACQTTGTCYMSDEQSMHATYRSQLDERKSLADWKTRKRSEDVRGDELYNDSLESRVRREENANSVGAMTDTLGGYRRAADILSGTLDTLQNFGR